MPTPKKERHKTSFGNQTSPDDVSNLNQDLSDEKNAVELSHEHKVHDVKLHSDVEQKDTKKSNTPEKGNNEAETLFDSVKKETPQSTDEVPDSDLSRKCDGFATPNTEKADDPKISGANERGEELSEYEKERLENIHNVCNWISCCPAAQKVAHMCWKLSQMLARVNLLLP